MSKNESYSSYLFEKLAQLQQEESRSLEEKPMKEIDSIEILIEDLSPEEQKIFKSVEKRIGKKQQKRSFEKSALAALYGADSLTKRGEITID